MQKQIETPKRAACRLDQLVANVSPFGSSVCGRERVKPKAAVHDQLRIEETRDIEKYE